MTLSAVVDSASTYSWSKHARNQAERRYEWMWGNPGKGIFVDRVWTFNTSVLRCIDYPDNDQVGVARHF